MAQRLALPMDISSMVKQNRALGARGSERKRRALYKGYLDSKAEQDRHNRAIQARTDIANRRLDLMEEAQDRQQSADTISGAVELGTLGLKAYKKFKTPEGEEPLDATEATKDPAVDATTPSATGTTPTGQGAGWHPPMSAQSPSVSAPAVAAGAVYGPSRFSEFGMTDADATQILDKGEMLPYEVSYGDKAVEAGGKAIETGAQKAVEEGAQNVATETAGGATAEGSASGVAGNVIGTAGVGYSAGKWASNLLTPDSSQSTKRAVGSGSGAVTGALWGTYVTPGLGTVVGAVIGTVAGWLGADDDK